MTIPCVGVAAPDDSALAAAMRDADALLAQAAVAEPDLLALEAVVNQQRGGTIFVRTVGGIALEEAALRRWRIRYTESATVEVEGRRFVPLSALPGATAKVEARTQRLLLTVPPQLFDPNAILLTTSVDVPLAPPSWSAYGNYELFGYTSKDSTFGSALFEVGVAGPYGVGIATAVTNSSELSGGTTGKNTLLDAYWRYDDPAGPRTWIAGTGISRAGAWGRSLRFGGVSYGTNFSLQPNLITYPVQAFSGTAVVPSTVDVFVNGSRVASQQVPPGPFNIENVPVVTGSGDVQLVVRDAFGQQQVVTQPFYASRQLLRPGLDDFTIAVGAERRNYGIDSFDYGSGFAAAYWRRGLTDTVTVEFLANGDNDAQAAGATVDFVPNSVGIVTLGAAGSTGKAGGGALGVAGYQYQGPRLNFNVRSTWASPGFRTPGDDSTNPLQRITFAGVGYNFGVAGTIGVAWADQQYRGLPNASNGTVSYATTVAPRTFLNFSVSRSLGGTAQTGAFLSLVYALDDKVSLGADVSTTRSGGSTQTVGGAAVQRSLPIGEGYGYRLRATTDQQYFAGGVYAGPYGRYSVDVASMDGATAARGSVAGGIGVLGGVAFASRPIVDSFALIRVDEVPGVHVYQNGNLAGRTDQAGNVVITQLYPYAANRITINDRDVPISITLDSRERLIAPYYRSGVVVDFGARRVLNALVEVRLPDGSPLPTGAEVRRRDGGVFYPVGEGGEVFISDLAQGTPYDARWNGSRCEFVVEAGAATNEPIPRLGPISCVRAKE
ncbi:MAG: fimbria/pilus outer membrane usher protein [Burkholderiales bacterium]